MPKLEKKYQTITIKEAGRHKRKPVFQIIETGGDDILGCIYYYAPWRIFVAEFNSSALLSIERLRGVADFMEEEI